MVKHYEELMTMADEVMDYMGWKEIDIDDIAPMYEALLAESLISYSNLFGINT